MKNKEKILIMLVVITGVLLSCENGTIEGKVSENKKAIDKSMVGSTDSAKYVDFSTDQYNALTWRREELMITLGNRNYKNGNSTIKISRTEGVIQLSSDDGFYNGKYGCQFYAKYEFDILGASSDCLYIRKNPKGGGIMMIDNVTYKNDQIPDLSLCIPLYGYSGNRIEVSSIMNGYIAMPSGTYWKQ
jgi:hypothetical protein